MPAFSEVKLTWSQRFFLIFPLFAKWRILVAKRRERKSAGYVEFESHFHGDASCQTRQIDNKKGTNGNLAITCLSGVSVSTWVLMIMTPHRYKASFSTSRFVRSLRDSRIERHSSSSIFIYTRNRIILNA